MKTTGTLNEIGSARAGRILFLLAAFILLATIVPPAAEPPPAGPAEAVMTAVPVPLDPDAPERRRLGPLVFLRGWVLDSDEPRFGGLSAMHVEHGHVTAVSDAGSLLSFALPVRAGAQPLRIRPLSSGAGASKLSRDSESMLAHGAQVWIAFERLNEVSRLQSSDWRMEASARPPSMRRWRGNSGAEAMVRLRDGRFLVFSEGRDDEHPYSPVIVFAGDPAEADTRAFEIRYRRPSGFRVTDAALLPDGRVLILNRRFGLFEGGSAILVVAEPADLRPGATLAGRAIAELGAPLTVDNMEALSVTREGGRTIVRIASDDNFMAMQRSLLLEFAWAEQSPSFRRRPGSRDQ